jgi:hypothetical protein
MDIKFLKIQFPISWLIKYLLFIVFFIIMLKGFFSMNIPSETPYDEMMKIVYRGMGMTLIGGLGSIACLFRITR